MSVLYDPAARKAGQVAKAGIRLPSGHGSDVAAPGRRLWLGRVLALCIAGMVPGLDGQGWGAAWGKDGIEDSDDSVDDPKDDSQDDKGGGSSGNTSGSHSADDDPSDDNSSGNSGSGNSGSGNSGSGNSGSGNSGSGNSGSGNGGSGNSGSGNSGSGNGGSGNSGSGNSGSGNSGSSPAASGDDSPASSEVPRGTGGRGIIQVRFSDGHIEQVRDGTFERTDKRGRLVEQRRALRSDTARLAAFRDSARGSVQSMIEINQAQNNVQLIDGAGWIEKINRGIYRLTDPNGNLVMRRAATRDDLMRITAMAGSR